MENPALGRVLGIDINSAEDDALTAHEARRA